MLEMQSHIPIDKGTYQTYKIRTYLVSMKYLTSKRQAIVRSMMHTTNLDIGSGENPITSNSVIADINVNGIHSAQLPYPDKLFTSITALELFEHLRMDELLCTMNEIKRVLDDDGQLIISIPNYSWYMYAFQNISWFIRRHTTLRSHNYAEHDNMQNAKHMTELLHYFGFEVAEIKRVYLYDIIIRAIKV